MNRLMGVCFLLTVFANAMAQHQTENLIIVTLDGMRWQEVFGGADTTLIKNPRYTKDIQGTNYLFGGSTAQEKRTKLFPFLWNVVAREGQLYGNRKLGNYVNNANPYKFSYPGYNEIFTGYPDTAVNSNDKVLNRNTNVLEFINKQQGYQNRVAVFATWDVFPYIFNKERSGIYMNADMDTAQSANPAMKLINDMQLLTSKPIDVRPDIFTYMAAREYMKVYQPKVLYIALDETDDFAHNGMYDQYLRSANAADRMIADLWSYIQSSAYYANKTTLMITCDHGRGEKDNWVDHGDEIAESGQVWIAAMGPDSAPIGEASSNQTIYQKQLAATFASLLGFEFTANHPVGFQIAGIRSAVQQTVMAKPVYNTGNSK